MNHKRVERGEGVSPSLLEKIAGETPAPRRIIVAVLLTAIAGCNSTPTKPLASVDFYAPHRQDDPILNQPQAQKLSEPTPPRVPKRVVQAAPQTLPSTFPATTQVSSSGEYMTLGGIVAVVNGKPIYASRILSEVRSALVANAREMDLTEYRESSNDLIQRQIRNDVKDELFVAMAQRKLDEKDKTMADRLTEKWRQEQITQAGGSVETARRSSVDIARRYNLNITNPSIAPLPEDLAFEQLVEEVHRRILIEFYEYRRIFSRIDVSAAEMRDYYNRNLDKQFTEHARARFRMIQIDPSVTESRDAAADRVGSLLRRALAGEDFARFAREYNTDPRLAAKAGDIGWIDRGAFRWEKVEKAVWETPVGQIAKDPVEDTGSYFLIKVEAKSEGRVRSFDELKTQEDIMRVMRSAQFAALSQTADEGLAEEAELAVSGNQQTVNTAIEMAMQMYAQWHKDKPLPTLGQITP